MKMEVTDVYLDEFEEDVKKLQALKTQANAIKAQITNLENKIISSYATQDPDQINEGTENLINPELGIGVKITYKLTKTIDKEKLEELCQELNKEPKHFCNVKYDYSATVFKALEPEEKQRFASIIKTKRAKTAVDLL